MRREGYEFQVSKPEVIFRELNGRRTEPVELAVIDVASGAVTHVVDLTELAAEQPATAMEMNGIAVDPGTGNWYVTGKNWSTLYEIDPQLS